MSRQDLNQLLGDAKWRNKRAAMSGINTSWVVSRAAVAALVVAVLVLAIHWSTPTGAHAAAPVVTSDIVLLAEDSYGPGGVATLAIRNDGDVPYVYNQYQQACYFTYTDASNRSFKIPPATHCDIVNQAEIAPGETVTVLSNWALDECILPGFFCFGVRPLPTGAYTISGSLESVGGDKRAEFSKTISITGPRFTSDVSLYFGVVVSDPPAGELPVFIELMNGGNVGYRVPQPACYLRFAKPDGHLFVIPPAIQCDGVTEQVLAPGGRLDPVTGWRLDECTQSGGFGSCVASQPLPAGVYTVSGALWSEDRQSYAEFSGTYTINAPAPTPSPSPGPTEATPVVLPRTGGPGAGSPPDATPGTLALGAALALCGAVVLTGATRAAGSKKAATGARRPGTGAVSESSVVRSCNGIAASIGWNRTKKGGTNLSRDQINKLPEDFTKRIDNHKGDTR